MKIKSAYSNTPIWKEFTVKSTLPKELECLDEIAHNMWWVWNYDARELFRSLDEDIYDEVAHNPVQLLTMMPASYSALLMRISMTRLPTTQYSCSSVSLMSVRKQS